MTKCLKCCGYDKNKYERQSPTTIYEGKRCRDCGELLDIKTNFLEKDYTNKDE